MSAAMTVPKCMPSWDPEKQQGDSIFPAWLQPAAVAEVAKRHSSRPANLFIARVFMESVV
jgi:hypothetical protein